MANNTGNTCIDESISAPFAPLGLIIMPGCEELGARVNNYLMRWRENRDAMEENHSPLFGVLGCDREDFLIDIDCPRFSTGEGKGMIKSTVRGYDIYIVSDIGAYNVTFDMYGRKVPMTPDDHFQDLKRIISAIGGRARRVNIIMPLLYEGRQHRRTSRESLDCALALQELQHMGVTNIVTFDAHDPRVQNAVPLIGFDSVKPTYQILKALMREQKDLWLDKRHMMIVSPDEGAIDRNIYYSSDAWAGHGDVLQAPRLYQRSSTDATPSSPTSTWAIAWRARIFSSPTISWPPARASSTSHGS